MTRCCPRHRMPWSGATGAIARGKNRSTGYARRDRSVHAWRWICGAKPKPKAVNKPSPHFIVHGLDKPGDFTTVSGETCIESIQSNGAGGITEARSSMCLWVVNNAHHNAITLAKLKVEDLGVQYAHRFEC